MSQIFDENTEHENIDEKIEFQTMLEAAKQGSPRAQLSVAMSYWHGVGVESNELEAFNWLQKAKSNKETETDAFYYIGDACCSGYVCQKNIKTGLYYLNLAIDRGDTDAMIELARLYFIGEDIPADYVKAYELLRKASEIGNPNAQLFLAERLETGDCVKKDIKESLKWYTAMALNSNQMNAPIGAFKAGEIYEKYYDSIQQAIDWYLIAATNEENTFWDDYKNDAAAKIGIAYKYGTWFSKDLKMALYWLKKSAPDLISFELGDLYEILEDYDNAILCYKETSLFEEDGESYFKLGNFYFKGEHVEKNIEEAISNFECASNCDHIGAMYKLGEIYELGLCGYVDESQALEWYKKAADNYHAGAIEKIAALTGKSICKTVSNSEINNRTKNRAAKNVSQKRRIADNLKEHISKNPNCPYCGKALDYNNAGSVHLDHIYPVSKGGDSVDSNLVYVCSQCNTKKGDMTIRNFIKKYGLNRDTIENRLEALSKDF